MIAAPHILRMSAYALAEMTAPPGKRVISLAQNESLRPASPKALAAGAAALAQAALYPDPEWHALRSGLAATHAVPEAGLLCGAGSLDLIGALARVLCGPDRAMLAPAHAYPFFRTAAQLTAARYDTAPETGCVADVDALLAAVQPDTGLVCLANPGNPTGTWLPRTEVQRLRDGLRDDIVLLVDEAYGEFAPADPACAFELVARGNLAVTRTFSKAYGLAGLRVGWGLFPLHLAAEMRKVLNPNNISAPAQAAAAAALQEQAYLRETVAQTACLRDDVTAALRRAGHRVVESHTNFVLIDFETPDRAKRWDRYLQSEGVFLRAQAGAGLPQMLRMTLGGPADVAVAQALLCGAGPP